MTEKEVVLAIWSEALFEFESWNEMGSGGLYVSLKEDECLSWRVFE
jgi:hypothetical protein